MGVNHVQLENGETVVDLRGVTVNEDVLLEGYTAIDSKGNPVTGKASPQGGGGIAVQSDYAENNSASAAYIKNRPFYEGLISSHFSSDETPNTPSISIEALGYHLFKVSDLMPKGEELFETTLNLSLTNDMTFSFVPTAENIVLQTDDIALLIFVLADGSQFGFDIFYKTGTISMDFMGTPVEVTVSEVGTYFIDNVETLRSNFSLDMSCPGIKKIDKKFLPEVPTSNSGGTMIIDISNISPDAEGNITVGSEIGQQLYEVSQTGQPCVIRWSEFAGLFPLLLHHQGGGVFTMVFAGVSNDELAINTLSMAYDHNKSTLKSYAYSSYQHDHGSTATTYGLRRPTTITFADFVEMMRQSAIERGLITETE